MPFETLSNKKLIEENKPETTPEFNIPLLLFEKSPVQEQQQNSDKEVSDLISDEIITEYLECHNSFKPITNLSFNETLNEFLGNNNSLNFENILNYDFNLELEPENQQDFLIQKEFLILHRV